MKRIPNILSCIRIVMVPLFLMVYFAGESWSGKYAAMIYLTASFTDVMDGVIARKFDASTKLGRILDPLADKLMTTAVFAAIALRGLLPFWAVAVLVAKELLLCLGSVVMFRQYGGDIPSSNMYGKLSTCLSFAMCFVLLYFDGVSRVVSEAMLGAVMCSMAAAFISYIAVFFNASRRTGG